MGSNSVIDAATATATRYGQAFPLRKDVPLYVGVDYPVSQAVSSYAGKMATNEEGLAVPSDAMRVRAGDLRSAQRACAAIRSSQPAQTCPLLLDVEVVL